MCAFVVAMLMGMGPTPKEVEILKHHYRNLSGERVYDQKTRIFRDTSSGWGGTVVHVHSTERYTGGIHVLNGKVLIYDLEEPWDGVQHEIRR